MADEQSPHDSELTREQESAVRRLLAEARHDEGVPEAVAQRLDRVLAQLREEGTDAAAPVVDLAARRRRRNAGRLLMAAAAIVLGGVGVGQFLGTSGGDSGDSLTSSTAEDSSARTESRDGDDSGASLLTDEEAAPEAAQGEAGGTVQNGDSAAKSLDEELPVQLHRGSFEEDVRSLAVERQRALDQLAAAADSRQDLLLAVRGFDCPPAAYGRGTLVPAYYGDQPTVLAFRPPVGSKRVAELLRCGTAEPLRSVDLD